jgi:GNAT superfamily N-acetyltransferase
MIRPCRDDEFQAIWTIINDGAQAYKGIIPSDRWAEPYMSLEKLRHEIEESVAFWGFEEDELMLGVMGLQHVKDVTLVRHAYVRTNHQGKGIGGALLNHLQGTCVGPVLVGTWADAVWAIGLYKKHGFELVHPREKEVLLRKYWTVPDRQIETSVVLANEAWLKTQR